MSTLLDRGGPGRGAPTGMTLFYQRDLAPIARGRLHALPDRYGRNGPVPRGNSLTALLGRRRVSFAGLERAGVQVDRVVNHHGC